MTKEFVTYEQAIALKELGFAPVAKKSEAVAKKAPAKKPTASKELAAKPRARKPKSTGSDS